MHFPIPVIVAHVHMQTGTAARCHVSHAFLALLMDACILQHLVWTASQEVCVYLACSGNVTLSLTADTAALRSAT